jgi:hypothetical protein
MYTPPPPPPQPPYQPPPPYTPPPPPQPGGTLDFAKPFTYVFEDPNWLRKVLMGGLFILAIFFFFIGIPFLLGYYARLTRNIIAGERYPLPEWDDLGGYFGEGLRLFGVAVVWVLPLIVIGALIVIPAALMTTTDNDAARAAGGVAFSASYCIQIPLQLILRFIIPIALLRAIVGQSFGAGLQFGRVWAMVKSNFLNFFLAFLISFISGMLALVGLVACVIGVIFTGFWSSLVNAHAYAQAYQLSPEK